jgi:hypothetical protein
MFRGAVFGEGASFLVWLARPHEVPPALGKAVKPACVPSLGAKYRLSRKSCQGKICKEPQNIRCGVLNLSIHSGACAKDHNLGFPAARPKLCFSKQQDRIDICASSEKNIP